MLREGGESGKALTSKCSKHSEIYTLFFPLMLLLLAFISPSLLSFTSFLSFHKAGREPPSKVLTVFQRQNSERDSSLKNHTKMAFSQNTWSPCFPLITHTHTHTPTGCKCVSRDLIFLDLHSFLLKFLVCDLSPCSHVSAPILQFTKPNLSWITITQASLRL